MAVYLNKIVSCNNSSARSEEDQIILLVFGVTALGSVATCSVAVLIVLCLKPPLYKLLIYRLALYQVFASLALSVIDGVALLQLETRISRIYSTCVVSAFLLEYCLWVKLLFVACLTFHLFFFAVFSRNLRKWEPFYIAFSTIFPAVPACIPLATSSYGTARAWCWIPDEKMSQNCTMEFYKTGSVEEYTLWLGPVTIALALDNIAVVAIFVTLLCRARNKRRRSGHDSEYLLSRHSQRLDPNKEAFKQMLPLLTYPVIFFILSLLPLVRRIYEVATHKNSFILALLHAILGPSWGFFSALALLAHICIIRRCGSQQKKTTKFGDTPFDSTDQTWKRSVPCTDASSSAVTRYIIPHESEVDEQQLAIN